MRMGLGRPGWSMIQGHQTWLAKHMCVDLELDREAGWRKIALPHTQAGDSD